MNLEISIVADTLIRQSSVFQCSLEEAWRNNMHPLITNSFTLKEIKSYIDKTTKLGEQYQEKFNV